jgi:hypothetical protein
VPTPTGPRSIEPTGFDPGCQCSVNDTVTALFGMGMLAASA